MYQVFERSFLSNEDKLKEFDSLRDMNADARRRIERNKNAQVKIRCVQNGKIIWTRDYGNNY